MRDDAPTAGGGALLALSDHQSLQERTYRALRLAVLNRELKVGERLYETQLAKQLGVSRNPVREAIRRLQQDGLIEVRPRSGIYVASISPAEADDIYRIRGALEGVAARLAAERASEDELAHFRDVIAAPEVHAAIAQNDGAIVHEADLFHRTIHECAHSQRLLEMLEAIYTRVQHYRNVTLRLPGRPEIASHGHLMIFQAIARRDGATAEVLMRDHIEGARVSLMRQLIEATPPLEAPHDSTSAADGAEGATPRGTGDGLIPMHSGDRGA